MKQEMNLFANNTAQFDAHHNINISPIAYSSDRITSDPEAKSSNANLVQKSNMDTRNNSIKQIGSFLRSSNKNLTIAVQNQEHYDRDSLWGHKQGLNEQIYTYNILLEDTSTAEIKEREEVQWEAQNENSCIMSSISNMSPMPTIPYRQGFSSNYQNKRKDHSLNRSKFTDHCGPAEQTESSMEQSQPQQLPQQQYIKIEPTHKLQAHIENIQKRALPKAKSNLDLKRASYEVQPTIFKKDNPAFEDLRRNHSFKPLQDDDVYKYHPNDTKNFSNKNPGVKVNRTTFADHLQMQNNNQQETTTLIYKLENQRPSLDINNTTQSPS